jgi:cytochrome P450
MQTEIRFNPTDPAFLADPYDFYRHLREYDPVHYEQAFGGWMLSRFEHVSKFMGDIRLMTPAAAGLLAVSRLPADTPADLRRRLDAYQHLTSSGVLFLDPPKHDRVRGVLRGVLRPAVFEQWRPRVQELVDELIESAADRGRVEFVSELARPITAAAIMRLLGLPDGDREQIAAWASNFTTMSGAMGYAVDPVGTATTAVESVEALISYASDALRLRRARRPSPGVFSDLVAAADATGQLNDQEVIVNIITLLVAAVPKTTWHLSAGLLSLLRHPDQLRDLREHPDLAASAADELLRYEPPVQIAIPQEVAEPFEIGGRRMERGQWVFMMIAAANRDPARFLDPDRLDLRRPPGRHLAFGTGMHNCLGAVLARVVGQEVFARMARRFPDMAVDPDLPAPAFLPVPNQRTLDALPLLLAALCVRSDPVRHRSIGCI